MSPWLRKILAALAVLVVVCFAHGPSLKIGLHGDELDVLARVDGAFGGSVERGLASSTRALFAARDLGVGPLAFASLAASRRAWSGDEPWDVARVPGLRIEHMALLLLGAALLGLGVRRALLPWTGRDQAAAAGTAACCLLAVHPFAAALVVSVTARGELLAVVFGAAAGWAFLRGRQERHYRWTAAAAVSAVLAGACSEVALLLAPVLAALELLSARRHRPQRVRLRTAATTLAVFGAATLVERAAAGLAGVPLAAPAPLAALAGLGREGALGAGLGAYVEKLGLAFLPANALVLGLAGAILCGLVLLCALQPALLAARAAPRLWGWFHLGWLLSLLLALLPVVWVDVRPDELTQARALVAVTVVMAIGLGVSATGVSGLRRTLLPTVAVIGYALVARADLRPWERCSDRVIHLALDLEAAAAVHGSEPTYLVLDPPVEEYGLRSIEAALPWILHPSFSPLARELGTTPLVRGITREAWRALTREPELTELCASGVVLVLGDPRRDYRRPRVALRLPEPSPSTGPSFWRAEGRSPALDLEPLTTRRLTVRALPGTDTSAAPVVFWRGRAELFEDGQLEGVWLAGPDGPVAVFDLEGSLEWQLAGRVRRLWFTGSLTRVVVAEVSSKLPFADVKLRPLSDKEGGWYLDPAPADLPEVITPAGLEPGFTLSLFDLTSLTQVRLPVTVLVRSVQPPRKALTVAGVEPWIAAADRQREVVWSLEYGADGRLLGRIAGWQGRGGLAGSEGERPLVSIRSHDVGDGARPGGAESGSER